MLKQALRVLPVPSATEPERHGGAVRLRTHPAWPGRAHLTLVPADDDRHTGSCELTLLDEFQLTVNGTSLMLGPSMQRLLVVLVCLGRQAPRNKVAQILWPDTANKRAQANLRTTLYRMQHQAPDLVHSTATHLRLTSLLRVDLETIRSVALTLLDIGAPRGSEPLPVTSWAKLGKDLLPDWDEEWLSGPQFSHRKLRLDALEQLAHLFISRGQYGVAVQSALVVIQTEPLRESAHEALIRAYLGQGNRAEAISHYTGYRRALRDELGLEPADTLGDLLWGKAN